MKYIDTYSNDNFHLQFNASLLEMCAEAFSDVKYYSSKSSKSRVYSLLKNEPQVKWRRICVLGGGSSRVFNISRLIISAISNIVIVLFSSKKETIFFNYNNLFSLFTVNFICKVKRQKIVVFCHGEMEFLIDENWGGVFVRLQRKIARRFFLKPRTSNITFVVMGDSILRNIKALVSGDFHFVSVGHSYIFGKTAKKQQLGRPMKIGTVGVLTKEKGFDNLCHLAQNVRGVNLSVTGKIFGDVELLERLGVDLPQNRGLAPLSGDEFSVRVEELDYILFLYPTNSYKLIASGAVMDSIDKCRPIISLKNDYFCYLFEKYGEFGYLYNDIDQMARAISEGLPLRAFDFKRLKERLSPKQMSNELKKI